MSLSMSITIWKFRSEEKEEEGTLGVRVMLIVWSLFFQRVRRRPLKQESVVKSRWGFGEERQ